MSEMPKSVEQQDKKSENLWEALKRLLDSLRRMLQDKHKVNILEDEMKKLEETVQDMSWISVANYDQIEALTEKIDVISKKLAVANKDEENANRLINSAKNDVKTLTGDFERLQETVKAMEEVFADCMKHNDEMDYEYAEVNGFHIFYSQTYAFDKEKADAQHEMVIFALSPNGNMLSYKSLEDMNKELRFAEGDITKEMLENSKGSILKDADEYCTNIKDKGEYVFRALKSELLKAQEQELAEKTQEIKTNTEVLEKVSSEKAELIGVMKKMPENILHGMFDTWVAKNLQFIATKETTEGTPEPCVSIRGNVCKVKLKDSNDFTNATLTFTLGEDTMIDKVTISYKDNVTRQIKHNDIYSVTDLKEIINYELLQNNSALAKVMQSTPFWAKQVAGNLLNNARLQQYIPEQVTDNGKEMLADMKNAIDNQEYAIEKSDTCIVITNDVGEHLLLSCEQDGLVNVRLLDDVERDLGVVPFSIMNGQLVIIGGEELKPALADMKHRFPDVIDKIKDIPKTTEARLDKETKEQADKEMPDKDMPVR